MNKSQNLSSIEKLSMKLNDDLSFAFLSKTWTQIDSDYLSPRINPLVCAINSKTLLVCGGVGIQSAFLIDVDKNKEMEIKMVNQAISSYSHGVTTLSGEILALTYDTSKIMMVAFKPDLLQNCDYLNQM